IERISFDPYNTRGEDIDYLINAKMFYFKFILKHIFIGDLECRK
ncbi:unnamed protein product, partial [marine sediment metagenome]